MKNSRHASGPESNTLAAQKLEPKVQPVTLPHRILRDEADLDAWLADARKAVLVKLSDGPVQL